jgi:hypothetical protein
VVLEVLDDVDRIKVCWPGLGIIIIPVLLLTINIKNNRVMQRSGRSSILRDIRLFWFLFDGWSKGG